MISSTNIILAKRKEARLLSLAAFSQSIACSHLTCCSSLRAPSEVAGMACSGAERKSGHEAVGPDPQLFLGPYTYVLEAWHVGPFSTFTEMPRHLVSSFLSSPYRPLILSHFCPYVLFPRFPYSTDRGQRAPGPELLLWLHADEAEALLRPGWGHPRGQARWAPPPYGLQCQCHCLLLPHFFLGAGPGCTLSIPTGHGMLEGRHFFLKKKFIGENKSTLTSPQLNCVVKHPCCVKHSCSTSYPRGLRKGFVQGLETQPQVLVCDCICLLYSWAANSLQHIPSVTYSLCGCQLTWDLSFLLSKWVMTPAFPVNRTK